MPKFIGIGRVFRQNVTKIFWCVFFRFAKYIRTKTVCSRCEWANTPTARQDMRLD